MKYIELSCTIDSPSYDIFDILVAELAELGYDSFDVEANTLKAYIPAANFIEKETLQIVGRYVNDESASWGWAEMADKNWNAVWESNFEPIVVDNRCTVRAPFHMDLPPTNYEIVIEPKMSFGTGHHATTYQMVEFLLDSMVEGARVLDMGCGTGILAILAAMKGAARVVAIDNDEWAFSNAVENVERNVPTKVEVFLGDATLLGSEHFDLILANINRNILLADMARYVEVLVTGGTLFLSGILPEDIDIVTESALSLGLLSLQVKTRNGWAALSFKK